MVPRNRLACDPVWALGGSSLTYAKDQFEDMMLHEMP